MHTAIVYVIEVCWQLASRSICSCSQAVTKPVWHIPLLCVQWKSPYDGQRNCPKHVEFHSKNKFEKSVHLVGFIIRNLSLYDDSLWVEQSGDQISVRGEIFRTPPDRPWGSPSLLYNRTISPSQGVKRRGRGVDNPPNLVPEVKESVELYLYSPSGPCYPVTGWNLTLFYFHILLNIIRQTQNKLWHKKVT